MEFKYFFMLDVLKFSEFAYGILFVMSCVTIIGLVCLFDYVFKHYTHRQGMAVALALTTITTIFDILFVLRWNKYIYIHDYIFVLFTNLFEDFIHMRYICIATGVICAKITPNSVEATVYSLFAGMGNLGFGVLGGLFGNFLANVL